MIPTDPSDIARKLIELKVEHRDLDEVIGRLSRDSATDQLQLVRLKKRKLRIKDMIAYLESKLIPDLDA
ncbi:MAG TPA: YdcH family protein [Xanthomonadales bacterium]|nr:YdcH family protein [Xanthomonadales bacterium]